MVRSEAFIFKAHPRPNPFFFSFLTSPRSNPCHLVIWKGNCTTCFFFCICKFFVQPEKDRSRHTRVIVSIHRFSILIFHFFFLFCAQCSLSFSLTHTYTSGRVYKTQKEKKSTLHTETKNEERKMNSAICGRLGLSPNHVFKSGFSHSLSLSLLGDFDSFG